MTILPRAATSPELTKLRSGNQSSRLFATFHQPREVYRARLVGPPSADNDNITAITYNSGVGSYTDILTDMRVDIGSVAGGYDLGTTRVHDLNGLGATSGDLHIERTSEIDWLNNGNAYITILDTFDLRARPPAVDGSGNPLMDTDIAYTDQHSKCKSTPIFPRYSVRWLPAGGTVTVVKDGSQSWALNNTITNYQWTAPGQSAISGDSTSVCTITYDTANPAAGYRVQLDLTNSDGVDSTGYGRVFVLASESDAYEITEPVDVIGSYQDGGWSAQVTMRFDADRSIIRDRAMVILHRRDWYGPTSADEGSIGYVADDENIELVGWIAGESIKWMTADQAGYVTFDIRGPQYLFDRLTMPPVGLKNISSHAPTNWKRFTGLTAKSMTWHILHWRTTAPVMMDCFAANSSVGALQFQSSGAQTVWQQISNVLDDFILAKPTCDSYARLFMQTEQNLLSAADRSSIPTVMTVTKDDWENEIDFDRRIVKDVSLIDLNGIIYDGTNEAPVYSLSPGRTMASGGPPFQRTRLAILDQASLNTLAGAAFGWQNNPYPNWRFVLPSNLHLIDIAPYQYLNISIASGDTPRGFAQSNLKLIPREIRRHFENGYVKAEVSIEADAPIGLGIVGDTPPEPPVIIIIPPPRPPIEPPHPFPTGNAREVWMLVADNTVGAPYPLYLVQAGDIATGGQPTFQAWLLDVKNFAFAAEMHNQLWIDEHGTRLFVQGTDVAGDGTLKECSNLASVRANPSGTTPTWSAMAGDGRATSTYTSIGGINSGWQDTLSLNRFRAINGVLYYCFRNPVNNNQCIGVHNGTAWTAYSPRTHPFTGPGPTLYYAPDITANPTYIRNITTDAVVDTVTLPFGLTGSFDWWCRSDAQHYTIWYPKTVSGNTHQILRHDGADAIDIGVVVTYPQWSVRGAYQGPQAYTVRGDNGDVYLSDDGSTFGVIANWRDSWFWDGNIAGGGTLWAAARGSVNNGDVPLRSYTRAGSPTDKTGNFWSVFNKASGLIVGMCLVYGT